MSFPEAFNAAISSIRTLINTGQIFSPELQRHQRRVEDELIHAGWSRQLGFYEPARARSEFRIVERTISALHDIEDGLDARRLDWPHGDVRTVPEVDRLLLHAHPELFRRRSLGEGIDFTFGRAVGPPPTLGSKNSKDLKAVAELREETQIWLETVRRLAQFGPLLESIRRSALRAAKARRSERREPGPSLRPNVELGRGDSTSW